MDLDVLCDSVSKENAEDHNSDNSFCEYLEKSKGERGLQNDYRMQIRCFVLLFGFRLL
jgi:hypothetical protein